MGSCSPELPGGGTRCWQRKQSKRRHSSRNEALERTLALGVTCRRSPLSRRGEELKNTHECSQELWLAQQRPLLSRERRPGAGAGAERHLTFAPFEGPRTVGRRPRRRRRERQTAAGRSALFLRKEKTSCALRSRSVHVRLAIREHFVYFAVVLFIKSSEVI